MPMMGAMAGHDDRPNLLSILINLAFGFIAGLMLFLGPKEVIAYGTKLAGDIMGSAGGGQMAQFGFAQAAPYVVLAPILGIFAKQLSAVRTIKGFGIFAAAVLVGFAASYFSQGYFSMLIA